MKTRKKQTFCMALLGTMMLGSCATSKLSDYDVRPENRPPGKMIRAASPQYTIKDDRTFAMYQDPYTVVKPEGKRLGGSGYYELYRAKEATYLTSTFLCPEDGWFFCFYSGDMLIDRKTGDRYMMRGLEYYPTDTCFWISGSAGKYVRFVQVFPPLPKQVKEIGFYQAGGPSRFNFDGSPKRIERLRVEDLRPKRDIPQGRTIW